MIRLRLFVLVIYFFMLSCCVKPKKLSERHYQNIWCDARGGVVEKRLSDGSRCDCVTAKYAIEFDWAGKWEAVEQSLNYARILKLKPGIVFICRKPGDEKKISRTEKNIKFYKLPIKVWRVNCGEFK